MVSELKHINSYKIKTGEQLDKAIAEIIRNYEHIDDKHWVVLVYEVRRKEVKK